MNTSDTIENKRGFKISQYACAVLLIVSSTALVAYHQAQTVLFVSLSAVFVLEGVTLYTV